MNIMNSNSIRFGTRETKHWLAYHIQIGSFFGQETTVWPFITSSRLCDESYR